MLAHVIIDPYADPMTLGIDANNLAEGMRYRKAPYAEIRGKATPEQAAAVASKLGR